MFDYQILKRTPEKGGYPPQNEVPRGVFFNPPTGLDAIYSPKRLKIASSPVGGLKYPPAGADANFYGSPSL